MSDLENSLGLQHEKSGILNCPSSVLRTSGSEMANNSLAMSESSNVANPFLASSGWDPLVSLHQVQSFGGSPMVSHSEFANSLYPPLVMENHQGMSCSSHHLVQYMPDSNFGDIVPKDQLQPYGSGSFSEMIGTFVQPGSDDIAIANTGYLPNYDPSNEMGIEKGQTYKEHSQREGSTAQEGDQGSPPSSENRRKRGLDYNSAFSPNKNVVGDVIKDCSGNSSGGMKEQGEKKPKVEKDTSPPVQGKQLAKQIKDNSHSEETSKENFIHVRARRGQATNSHSLAERVRREKISERMRVLQELVPGCNKITGKAVMLDEIINYVQSLQQQVEFLSMKLATVNPELNIDLERILSKDILRSRFGHGPIGGHGPGDISCSQPFPTASFQGTLIDMPGTTTQLPPLPQAVIDQEFQSLYGMSYNSNAALENMGPNNNGRLKSEL